MNEILENNNFLNEKYKNVHSQIVWTVKLVCHDGELMVIFQIWHIWVNYLYMAIYNKENMPRRR